ncbi:unnamed protein product [Mytilus edulis]|uniref:Tyr recombinase domain-containing protein n=1 Tax=Mytilus edulis TaxID=6550 RepID=A0A8S3V0B8_MYTED|nr:unnamed protein product [Mytilus edulis]
MCIRVTKEKADNIIKLCSRLILKEEITIREFAQVIGKLVATEPGVQYAPLYIKSLEITKDLLLKQNYGNFDAKMTLSDGNISDLNWWVNNINSSFKPMTFNYGLSKESSEIIIASWKPATRQQYWTYFKRWLLFCSERKINSFKATELNVLEFLTSLYKIGLGYSAINTARSMLSSFMSVNQEKTVGQWPLVKRFLKGIFNLKPSLPRYQRTWDVEVVLKYLKTLTPVYMLSLRVLSYKLVTLLLLLTGQRLQTIHSLDLDDITVTDSNIYIDVRSLLKCSKPGRHLQPIELPAFIEDKSLCIVTVLKEYLVRTSCFRKTQKLILSCIKPYSWTLG